MERFSALIGFVVILGIAFLLSALTVCYRDLRFLIPFISQIWMWLSAVAYPPNIFKNHVWLLIFNPLFGIFDTYRALIFKGVGWHPWHLLSSIVSTFAILIFGRYQQARDDGCDHANAVTVAVQNLGRAVFFGALTTAVGFLALLLAGSAGRLRSTARRGGCSFDSMTRSCRCPT